MDEKKLTDEVVADNAITDEEIEKALQFKAEHDAKMAYIDGCAYKIIRVADVIDFIHRLQAENEKLRNAKTIYESVDYCADDLAKALKTIDEKQAEIERLTEEANQDTVTHIDICTENLSLRKQNAELQKQVDELKEELEKAYEIERANIQAEIAEAGTSCHWCKQQAVKDTANEILTEIGKEPCEHHYLNWDCEWFDRVCKKYGVEVE